MSARLRQVGHLVPRDSIALFRHTHTSSKHQHHKLEHIIESQRSPSLAQSLRCFPLQQQQHYSSATTKSSRSTSKSTTTTAAARPLTNTLAASAFASATTPEPRNPTYLNIRSSPSVARSQRTPATQMSFFTRLFSSCSSSSPVNMAEAKQTVQKYIDENNVVVFSKSYCPYCRATKQTLKSLGADYVVVELDQRDDGSSLQDALQEISGQRTVPNVYIGHKHVGGNSDVQDLSKAGKLQDLLQSAGAIKA